MNGVPKHQDIFVVAFGFVILSFTLGVVMYAENGRMFTLLSLTFLTNAIILSFLISKFASMARVNLGLMHLIGIWMILVLGPYVSYVADDFYGYNFFSGLVVYENYIATNLLICIWSLVFTFGYGRGSVKIGKVVSHSGEPTIQITAMGYWFQFAAGIVGIYLIVSLVGFGVTTRGAFEVGFSEIGASTIDFLIYVGPVRSASILAWFAGFVLLQSNQLPRHQRQLIWYGQVALGIAIVVLNNPIAAARFYTGIVVLAFSFLYFFRHHRTALPFLGCFLIGIILIFPLDFGRSASDFAGAIDELTYDLESALKSDNFRSYEAIPASLVYLDVKGIDWGRQFIGNLMFWIPRTWWADKPIGTGSHLAESFNEGFTNVACPLQCEALVNFGLFGLLLFAFVFGVLVRKIDDWSERLYSSSTTVGIGTIVYPILLGGMFFLTRGDLLSPLAFITGILLSTLPTVLFGFSWRRGAR